MTLGRNFYRLLGAAAAANLADGMLGLMLPILALASGASPFGVSIVTTASVLAWPILGLHAGLAVDHFNRITVLALANLVRSAMLAIVFVLQGTDNLRLAVVIGLAAIYGVSETLVDTALAASVPAFAGVENLGAANSRMEATINLTNSLIGPPLAGALIAIGINWSVGVACGLYLGAVGVIRGGSVPMEAAIPASQRNGGVLLGLKHIWSDRVLRFLTCFTAAMNLIWGAWAAFFVVYAVSDRGLSLTATQCGFIFTAAAIGGILSSILTTRLQEWIGTSRLLLLDCLGTVLLVAPIAFDLNAWFVAAGAVVAGAGSSVWRILVAVIRQQRTAPELLGRTYSASRVISYGIAPVGAISAGIISKLYSVRVVFALSTALAVVLVVIFAWFAVRGGLDSETGHFSTA